MKRFSAVVVIATLAGCSSTPEALEQSKSADRTEKVFSENYQEVYRRLVRTARLCSGGNSGRFTSFELDTELYSELGYGEVTLSLQNMGTRNYYWKAKVEKAGSGSRLSVVSGNTLAQDSMLKTVVGWAEGNEKC
ncbi:hypothetical protein SAMN05892877_117119 [Rhizobium subbaraonis]|uniref:Lipoprotein n=1 Tax=Rhizobium subbaraonis TaxID=908946 RepID=A0A285UV86_9HYPH|nr:hypothetical protein [Rhizobium subbaraonis]SOC45730.1 hypothetical protein SAMN05892877_117119 [Rhizobium subbaraonis]